MMKRSLQKKFKKIKIAQSLFFVDKINHNDDSVFKIKISAKSKL